jgi:diguanylate cyclase (GGDEF)-like protein
MPSVAAAFIGIVLSVSAWFAVSGREDRLAAQDFSVRAQSQALALQSGIEDYLEKIDALRALFQASDDVTRHEFATFNQFLLRNRGAILATSWIPRVTREERTAHELAARRDGLRDYRIKAAGPDGGYAPVADLSEHFPVLYSSREPPDSPVYGLDLNDGGVRQQTLERARDSGGFATSPTFTLRSGSGERNGFFVALPVYRHGERSDTLEERRRNLVGFVQGVFQTGALVDTILANTATPAIGMDLYLFAASNGHQVLTIYRRVARLAGATPVEPTLAEVTAGPHWSDEIEVGDARWTLVAVPIAGGPGTAGRLGSWIVLIGGLLITAAVVAYFWAAGRHARRLQAANAQLDESLVALNQANEQLRAQNIRFDAALSNMSQAVLLFDASGRLVMSNRRYGEMYGLPPEFIKPGCTVRDLVEQRRSAGTFYDDVDDYLETLHSTIAQGRSFEQVFELPDGRTIAMVNQPMAGGGWVATHEDITERRRADAKISYMARHDALTDLPNRLLFHERLGEAINRGKHGEQIAVLCLDIDQFKSVNDTLGHSIGDMLLRIAAERLRGAIREVDTVARVGGDEFAVVQIGANQPSDAIALATRLIQVISAPYQIEDHQVVVGMTIGIAVAPADGNSPEQLLKNADMALYRAKAEGRGIYRFFEPEMDARAQARRLLELDLRKAIATGEFELFYQPLVDIKTEIVSGFEALIRWRHPLRGLIAPGDFIPVAEETGLIVSIGEWVLRTACKEAATWPNDIRVAVNLSPVQFRSKNLVPTVVAALAGARLSPRRLELEITESVLLEDSEVTLATMQQLRGLGVRISMDDFGTGYSSLSYLRKFPFDKIKIDRSFIRDMSVREDSVAIVRAVAALGASLGIVTTAEGVETLEQLERLRREGCTEAQGYFFSPPCPAAEVRRLLASIDPRKQAIA